MERVYVYVRMRVCVCMSDRVCERENGPPLFQRRPTNGPNLDESDDDDGDDG